MLHALCVRSLMIIQAEPIFSFKPCCLQLSIFGGSTVTLAGVGFVSGLTNATLGRTMFLEWDSPANGICVATASASCAWLGAPPPPLVAAAAGALPLQLLSSDGATAVFRIGRYSLADLPASAVAAAAAAVAGGGGSISTGALAPPATYLTGNATLRSVLRWRLRVFNSGVVPPTATEVTGTLAFCGGRTPAVTSVAPATVAAGLQPSGGVALVISWQVSLAGSSNGTWNASAAGSSSAATVELVAVARGGSSTAGAGPLLLQPLVLNCSDARVNASSLGSTSYNETLRCQLPAYVPAGTYTLWLCAPPLGCGYAAASWTAALQVSGFAPGSAMQGPASGGTEVTVVSSGHSLDPAAPPAARFGGSACAVLAMDASSFRCRTGAVALPAGAASATLPLSVTPAPGADEVTFSNVTFTFAAAGGMWVTAVSPTQGPVAGGTALRLSGSGFDVTAAAQMNVTIGGVPCGNVNVLSSDAITCVTGPLLAPVAAGGAAAAAAAVVVPGQWLDVVVSTPGRVSGALSAGPNGSTSGTSTLSPPAASFRYLDAWSSPSSWPSGRLPQAGDDVAVAAGRALLLDVSPPPLGALLVLGWLVFDDTQPALELQARSILIDGGGRLSVGSADQPYASAATITLIGNPPAVSPDDSGGVSGCVDDGASGAAGGLALYGTKVIAVRQGVLEMYGTPRSPPYTTLNITANPGDGAILVNGAVDWKVRSMAGLGARAAGSGVLVSRCEALCS